MKFTTTLVILSFVLALTHAGNDPYENNPFYVDYKSVKASGYRMTMNLKNHHNDTSYPDPLATATNPEIMLASVRFESLDRRVLRFKMFDAIAERWEAPIYTRKKYWGYHPALISDMGIKYENQFFSFGITDPKTKNHVLSTKDCNLKFYDKYIEFTMRFPSQRAFGLGERVKPDFQLCHDKNKCIYTTFTKDATSPLDDGTPGAKQVYAHHPFYMIQLKDGLFIGILFLNSNAQDTVITKFENGTMEVKHIPIGGIIDTYIIYPEKADDVMKKYQMLIGRPYMPPFWSLGFHQCRWGWKTLDVVKDVVAKYREKNIPLEAIWSDIDYMKDYADFSIDPVRFKGLGEFVDNIHKTKMHWIPIIDAGIKYGPDDPYYVQGERDNAFVKSAATKKTLVGKVWPGRAVYPDWYNDNATKLWHKGLSDLHKMAKFDGIWIDMNEASNFCNGECPQVNLADDAKYDSNDIHDPREFDNLPYVPGNRSLEHRAISLTGYHYSTNYYDDKFRKEYNLHSLWAIDESKATHSYFTDVLKTRPFIVSRSGFVGSGIYASKWLGDNFSKWEYMAYSISGVYDSQLFGIPMNGADICGFVGNTTEELCLRWMQMGAFYPFSRNHNTHKAISQEPYVWDSVAKASRNAIRQKYSILRYYYTKLFEVSLYGGSLYRPSFFDYPKDEKAYIAKNDTFLIGSSILVAPALLPKIRKVTPYCPNANWYNLRTGERLVTYDKNSKEGKVLTLDADYEYVNVLLKGGSIIPFQDAFDYSVRTTEFLKTIPMELIIALDHTGSASGSYIVDDDETINPIDTEYYRKVSWIYSSVTRDMYLTVKEGLNSTYPFEKINKISIWGASELSDIRTACIIKRDWTKTLIYGSYNSDKKILTFKQSLNITWKEVNRVKFGVTC